MGLINLGLLYFVRLGRLCYFSCRLDCITCHHGESSAKLHSIHLQSPSQKRTDDMIWQILQTKMTSWRCEIRHTYNSTQTHMQSTHSVNESCVTVSKGQAHTNTFHKKPVLRSPCMRTDSRGCLFKPPCGFTVILSHKPPKTSHLRLCLLCLCIIKQYSHLC